jgi:DNA-binding CsgD family transcriptional regulator
MTGQSVLFQVSRTKKNRAEAILREVNKGRTRTEVAVSLGIHPQTVSRYCHEFGVECLDSRGRPETQLFERNQQIVAFYMEHHTLEEVGQRFGITRERVRQILNKCGVKPRSHTPIPDIPRPPKKSQTLRERFWALVDQREDGCWEFQGFKYPSGYGRFAACGRTWYAHRLAFMLHHWRSPQRWVLHHCDNPSCVRPDHLYDGTPKDNVADRDKRGRSAYIKDPEGFKDALRKGYAAARAKGWVPRGRPTTLDMDQIKAIKARSAQGESVGSITKDFPVTHQTIYRICTGRSWADVGENFLQKESTAG